MYSIIAIGVFAFFIGLGFHQGFLRRILSLVSIIIAGIAAWILSAVLHTVFPIFPREINPFVSTPLESIAYQQLDKILWFVILFVVISAAVMLLRAIFKEVNKVPIIGFANRLLGSIFGFVEAFVILSVFCMVLKLPIVDKQSEIVNSPVLSVVDHTSSVLFFSGNIMEELNTLNKMSHGEQLTQEEKDQLIKKAVEMGISKEDAESFMSKY